MDGFKMVRLFLVLAFAMSVASQPLENIGGATLSTHFLNWAQVGFEAFLEWAKRGFRLNTDEENTTTTTDEPMSKLLILTGWPTDEAKKIEVVDLQNQLNSCSLPEEFPTRLTNAVGGFTNDKPLLCSGYNYDTASTSNACFTLKNSKFTEVEVKLQTERSHASAVVLPNGELWIQGGWDGNNRLSTTERISLEGSQTGMELEKGMTGHCSMMINATTAFITGGYTGSSTKETYFVDIHNWKWTKGPQMEEARRYHGCSLFMHNNHNYALVSGGEYPFLSSTEILNLDSGIMEWTKGPELPVKMAEFPLVSTSQGIMAVGGYDNTNGRRKDEILQLKCQDGQEPKKCEWKEFPKKLDVARNRHVVIPLPASYEICNN